MFWRKSNPSQQPSTQANQAHNTTNSEITNTVATHQPANAAQPTQTANQTQHTPPQLTLSAHPKIAHTIVVASGKGGVGKSTTAVNIALALKDLGYSVGILDADIYGPSVPAMLGLSGQTPLIENDQFLPLEAYGLAVMSIGFLTGDDTTPIVWRGSKATGALLQLYGQTLWPHLDYLIIDMPPGTGDIQLTLSQRIPVTGAVVVTTPQHIALLDAQKGIEMFKKVHIKVLGVVENMAVHICSNCGHSEEIFGHGGGAYIEQNYHTELLGQLPLDINIRQNADQGKPSVVAQDKAAATYIDIAAKIAAQVNQLNERPRNDKRFF